jgi:hypothetical protein
MQVVAKGCRRAASSLLQSEWDARKKTGRAGAKIRIPVPAGRHARSPRSDSRSWLVDTSDWYM